MIIIRGHSIHQVSKKKLKIFEEKFHYNTFIKFYNFFIHRVKIWMITIQNMAFFVKIPNQKKRSKTLKKVMH